MVIVDDFSVLQLPRLGFRTEKGARRDVIRNNIVVGVLLEYLHVIERIGALQKILNEPRAQVRTITKNLCLKVATSTRLRSVTEWFASHVNLRRQRIG